jgi:dihydroorotase
MKMMKYDLVIQNGFVINPALGFGRLANLYIKNNKIAGIEKETKTAQKIIASLPDERIIDAEGMLVVPGFIDIHVHLREPGREYAETIVSGCRAAAAGGFTSVCCMPNTFPVIDNQETVQFVSARAEKADARVYSVGAISKELKGEELSEIGDLVKAGVVSISDDGNYVQNPELMRRALEYAKMFNIPVTTHAEDLYLSGDGIMNESFESTRLGMKGRPAVGEEIAILRDIKLCDFVGSRLHVAHVSTVGGVEAIRQAKKVGVKVTAEACPHHFILTDDEIGKRFDTNLKVNPPIRAQKDVDAVIAGLVDGTIDCIASDHAPHALEEKDVEFDKAPAGMLGLQTTVGLVKTYLIDKGYMSWADAVRKMTINPARIMNLPGGTLNEGALADITVINPDKKWTFKEKDIKSISRNSPYIGWKLSGKIAYTLLEGKVVYKA